MAPTDWEGDREAARKRFLESAFVAATVMPAWRLNFFAWRILFHGLEGRDGAAGGAESMLSIQSSRSINSSFLIASTEAANAKRAWEVYESANDGRLQKVLRPSSRDPCGSTGKLARTLPAPRRGKLDRRTAGKRMEMAPAWRSGGGRRV
jgi:hypothetical protein